MSRLVPHAAAGVMSANLLNWTLSQIGWFALVLGAAADRPWAGSALAAMLIASHLALVRDRGVELRLMIAAGAVGFVVDSLQVAAGRLTFESGTLVPWLCPPWIILLWMQFATTFRFGLRWFVARPALAALLAAAGAPIAYLAGARLGAVRINEPWPLSIAVMAALWLAVVPVFARLASGYAPGVYRVTRPRR